MEIRPQNLLALSETLNDPHQNILLGEVNDHCVRLAVNDGTLYDWHCHPNSDELFLVVEGELLLELRDGQAHLLTAGDIFKVPAGAIHRTITKGRTINLCFESKNAQTVSAVGQC